MKMRSSKIDQMPAPDSNGYVEKKSQKIIIQLPNRVRKAKTSSMKWEQIQEIESRNHETLYLGKPTSQLDLEHDEQNIEFRECQRCWIHMFSHRNPVVAVYPSRGSRSGGLSHRTFLCATVENGKLGRLLLISMDTISGNHNKGEDIQNHLHLQTRSVEFILKLEDRSPY